MRTVQLAVRRFASAVNRRALCGRLLQVLAVVAGALAALLLVVRALGGYLEPSWWWTLGALPVAAGAWLLARRQWLGGAAAAAHLDRRLGAEGLVLAAAAAEAPLDAGWQRRVDRLLTGASAVLPRLRRRRLLPPALAAVAAFALVAALPAPSRATAGAQRPAVAAMVERLAERFEELRRAELPAEVEQELREKVEEMRERVAAGEAPAWSELDRLDERLDRQTALQQLAREARQGDAATQPGSDSAPLDAASLASALAEAAARLDAEALAGLDLPPGLREALDAARNGANGAPAAGALDAGALAEALAGLDPATLQALAEAMAQRLAAGAGASGEAFAGALPQLDPAARQQLAELLRDRGRARTPEHRHGPECEGGT